MSFQSVQCSGCGRQITVRSLERHRAVDRVVEFHKERGTLFDARRFEAPYDKRPDVVALLEDIRSLWNVGSIFRTADGAGCKHLFLTGITGYPPRKEIEKTSLGAEAVIHWSYAANSVSVLPFLKSRGYAIISLERTERSCALIEIARSGKLTRPLCLVVGNEVTGLYSETLSSSDYICHLPMRGVKSSLNVAVAFGIGLYQITDSLEE